MLAVGRRAAVAAEQQLVAGLQGGGSQLPGLRDDAVERVQGLEQGQVFSEVVRVEAVHGCVVSRIQNVIVAGNLRMMEAVIKAATHFPDGRESYLVNVELSCALKKCL